jgi:hypothetical protein
MIHQPNDAGPAPCMTAEFVMNSTMATKIATMSNVVSTLGRIPPATRSEIRSSLWSAVVMAGSSGAVVNGAGRPSFQA